MRYLQIGGGAGNGGEPGGGRGGGASPPVAVRVRGLNVHYGGVHAVKDVTLDIPEKSITSIIGPSGCGKSSLLRSINRMNDLVPGARVTGRVLINGLDVYGPGVDVVELRGRVGMVFQRPNPFPASVYENVAYGPRRRGIRSRSVLDEIVERSLREAALWDEVEHRLRRPALELSGGQQQRLCIARALAVEPQVLLMDEPASALDPLATARIEDLIDSLSGEYTIVIVTHNLQQAARVSGKTAFLLGGELVEFGPTETMFTRPLDRRTEDYITGRFG